VLSPSKKNPRLQTPKDDEYYQDEYYQVSTSSQANNEASSRYVEV
jgi:hypothetical protein